MLTTMFTNIEPPISTPVSDEELPDFVLANIAKRARCEELEIQILTVAAQINASNYNFLKLLAEFDEKGGWHGDGIKSFAHWLLLITSRENRHGLDDGTGEGAGRSGPG